MGPKDQGPPDHCWVISIDVGGTFTDCVATDPLSQRSWTKVLSSGVTKGVALQINKNSFCDRARIGDGDGFWVGFEVVFLDGATDGRVCAQIVEFISATGTFRFEPALRPAKSTERYELSCCESAPLLAIRKLTGVGLGKQLPDIDVRLGTTRGTNALLTRGGSPTALVTTQGFGDVLEIGEQNRPELFSLAVKKHKPLYQRVVEINERVLADGLVRQKPQVDQVRRQLVEAKQFGTRSVAICFLHGYKYPEHEQLVGEIATDIGFDDVSLSSDVAPFIKIVARGETTVLDAYLNPVLRNYLNDFSRSLSGNSRLRMMTSAGGLVSAQQFSGRNCILSGPAGGVVGFSSVARSFGFEQAIGFDMGGTSTDVARFGGEFEKCYESFKAGVRVVAPMMSIETVAAGGGSVCRFDGTRLLIGPESAGAEPGPACYGRGGPLCVTDLNVFLGRIVAEQFAFPLDTEAVQQRLVEMQSRVCDEAGVEYTLHQLAEGLLNVANTNMSSAVRSVSVSRGYDPREHVLVAFGGAASQHACQVARQLGIQRILAHPLGGILSAVGISMAVQSVEHSAPLDCSLAESNWEQIDKAISRVADSAVAELSVQVARGVSSTQVSVRRLLDLRYSGTRSTLTVTGSSLDSFRSHFESRHQSEFGYLMPKSVEVCAVRVEAHELPNEIKQASPMTGTTVAKVSGSQKCFFGGQLFDTSSYSNSDLVPGQHIIGPAIVDIGFSSVWIEPAWQASVLPDNVLLLEFRENEEVLSIAPGPSDKPDPVQLEIFNNHFSSIAENMGEMLRKTSVSVNVKERLDFSCAIFTSNGDLVVNAPHVPVHLGAMGETVKSTINLNPNIRPGDVFVSNDPFRGGSHLPDVTVITPVFDSGSSQILFFVASRCHHAEIGGITAGSMPPDAKCLAEEGVLISNFKLVDQGSERYEELERLLRSGRHPSRSPDQNISDLMAQVAANRRGVNELWELVGQNSLSIVTRYMQFIQEAAEKKTRAALVEMEDFSRRFSDKLDCGAKITAAIEKTGDRLRIDFTGTDAVLENNLNANRAITTSAVLYCLRCLIRQDIPLNQGILNPVEIVLPECFINPSVSDDPRSQPAVSGGNVETSQRIVDVILGGLGLAAASQGTMNNFLMGDQTFGYYETICGGTGATISGPGVSAVHSHMTNTRLTDAEILESEFPVILNQFAIRRGSGGAGRHFGGDGVVREFEFTAPLTVTLITNRRITAPYGFNGGQPGEPGKNQFIPVDSNGRLIDVGFQGTIEVRSGDRLRIETPGGGGWGSKQ